jgi:hypothetical protein
VSTVQLVAQRYRLLGPDGNALPGPDGNAGSLLFHILDRQADGKPSPNRGLLAAHTARRGLAPPAATAIGAFNAPPHSMLLDEDAIITPA